MSSSKRMGDTTTVGFRCDKQTKDDLQRRLVELQSEDKIPLNAKKSDVLRALAKMWIEGEIEIDSEKLKE